MESALLVGTLTPFRGTVKVYFAPKVGSAPWNSMEMEVGGVTGVTPFPLQAIVFTVWGGPTVHVFAPWATRTGGWSTVLRVHWSLTLTISEEMEEMERTLSVGKC